MYLRLLTAICLASMTEGARILAVFPYPTKSHHQVFQPLLIGLAARGHSVVFLTPQKLQSPVGNVTEVLMENMQAELARRYNIIKFPSVNLLHAEYILYSTGLYFLEAISSDPGLRKIIDSDMEFDVILAQTAFAQEALVVLKDRFKCPLIDVMAGGTLPWAFALSGAPFNPSYMVDFNVDLTESMTFWQRVYSSLTVYGTLIMINNYFMPKIQEIADKHYRYKGWEGRPSLAELQASKSLVLQNAHFSINYAYALPPNVVDISGIHIRLNDTMSEDLKTFLDGATDGFIYFSLGTIVRATDVAADNRDTMEAFFRAFRNVKQRVLVKWENDTIVPNISSNVLLRKWFPQQAVLAHKNCLMFISHGGVLSLTEAIYRGVPIVGVPFFADQPKNMLHAAHHGYGVMINYFNVTEKSVTWAINEVLSNPSYKEAAINRSKIFNDRPMSPLDTAIYWTEYVIRHKGAPHLRPALATMPWYKSMLLDVASLFLTALAIVFALIFLSLKRLTIMISVRWKETKNKRD